MIGATDDGLHLYSNIRILYQTSFMEDSETPKIITCFFGDFWKESSKAWATELEQAIHHQFTTPVLRACCDVDVPKICVVAREDAALPMRWHYAIIGFDEDDSWSVVQGGRSHSPCSSCTNNFVGILESLHSKYSGRITRITSKVLEISGLSNDAEPSYVFRILSTTSHPRSGSHVVSHF